MNARTRRSNRNFKAPVDNPEHLVRRTVGAAKSIDDDNRPTGREENTPNKDDLMNRILERASDRMDIDRGSLTEERVGARVHVGRSSKSVGSKENDAGHLHPDGQ